MELDKITVARYAAVYRDDDQRGVTLSSSLRVEDAQTIVRAFGWKSEGKGWWSHPGFPTEYIKESGKRDDIPENATTLREAVTICLYAFAGGLTPEVVAPPERRTRGTKKA